MRLLLAAALLLVWAAVPAVLAKCANGVVVRRDWTTLSENEKRAYIRAVRKLQEQPNGGASLYDKLVNIHNLKAGQIHSVPNFLPWHRLFLFVFETLLRRIDSNVGLPYWNWQADASAPELADIWSDSTDVGFGKNGDPNSGYCVKTGAFKDWTPKYPTPHCLRRQWSELDRIASFTGGDLLAQLMFTAKNYRAFEPGLERLPHGQVHNAIGGDVGDMSMMYSPNDPIFFLHHANIDKIWADWQALNPSYVSDYAGTNYDGTPAQLTDILVGFKALDKNKNPVPIKVSQVMKIGNLCYTYEQPPNEDVDPGTGGSQNLIRRLLRRGNGAGIDLADLKIEDGAPIPDAPHNCARGMPTLLLIPEVLSATWIKMNGGNENDYRSDESKQVSTIGQLNKMPWFIPVSAPWNRRRLLRWIIANVGTLYIFAKGKRITINTPNGGDPEKNVDAVKAAIRNALGGSAQGDPNSPENQQQLAAIIPAPPGNWQGSNVNNPWRHRG